MPADVRGLILSYLYLFAVLSAGELIRKSFRLQSSFTRKCIHVGVGLWGIGAYFLFESWWAVLIPPVSFVAINLLSFKWTLFKSMEIEDRSNLGTVYYPLSLAILILLFWRTGHSGIAVLGLLIMALGDGFASIIGESWGRHRYRIWGKEKSWEGSAAMALFSFLAAVFVLSVMIRIPVVPMLRTAFVLAVISTAVEALSPIGTDNITVPLLSAAAAYILL